MAMPPVIDSDGHYHEPHYLFDEFIEKESELPNLRFAFLEIDGQWLHYWANWVNRHVEDAPRTFMYASDYPHGDTEWERVQETQALENLAREEKDDILGNNAARFYKL